MKKLDFDREITFETKEAVMKELELNVASEREREYTLRCKLENIRHAYLLGMISTTELADKFIEAMKD